MGLYFWEKRFLYPSLFRRDTCQISYLSGWSVSLIPLVSSLLSRYISISLISPNVGGSSSSIHLIPLRARSLYTIETCIPTKWYLHSLSVAGAVRRMSTRCSGDGDSGSDNNTVMYDSTRLLPQTIRIKGRAPNGTYSEQNRVKKLKKTNSAGQAYK